MISYRKTSGLVHDLRLVAEGYEPIDGEIIMVGEVLPPIDSLCDGDALAARNTSIDRDKKRVAALRVLMDATLAVAIADPDAPQAVKDYAATLR